MNELIYSHGQVFAQRACPLGDGGHTAERYLYLHDRLGSVRQIIDSAGAVVKYYTCEPFGQTIESGGTFDNAFAFTGQYFDAQIGEYHLRARQYSPKLARFTARDPVFGEFQQPLTLHKYLYCGNDPLNRIDLDGLWTVHVMQQGMLSCAGSVTEEMGFVFDDKGNMGFITTLGWGGGTPAASFGGTIGLTNADNIFSLRGWGGAAGAGGTIPFPLPSGGNFIFGGEGKDKYVGFEVNFGWTLAPLIEMHAQATYTTVKPLLNIYGARDKLENLLDTMMYNVTTVGEGYGYLLMRSIIEDVVDEGRSEYADKILSK
ncbi:MAG: RHS repeat-associated core domain-containing protein [Sedimentisphaerales bacterium]|nr:RHS repeat-associated core domain-containing protein [Sedimentisphaerales bacterium]